MGYVIIILIIYPAWQSDMAGELTKEKNMSIEPGYYAFRATATDKQGEMSVRHSGLLWCPDADVLKEHKQDFIKLLVECGCKGIKITHTEKKEPEGYVGNYFY